MTSFRNMWIAAVLTLPAIGAGTPGMAQEAGAGTVVEMAVESPFIVIDRKGIPMQVSPGITKAEFQAQAKAAGIEYDALTPDEFRIGYETLIFESGKLSKRRSRY